MTDLMQLQNDFQSYVLQLDPRMNDQVIGTKKVSAQQRLEIYANAYRYRLLDNLIDDYEKLFALLGDEQFIECGTAYIDAYPSTCRSMRWFSQYMSEFLRKKDPYSQQPFLAEIATFEWGLMNTFDSADNALITVEGLANIPPTDWANISFTFTASLQRLYLQWNAVEIWKAIDEGQEPPSPHQLKFPKIWILWRKDLETLFRSLSVEEAWAIDAAIQGKSFGDICEGLCKWIDEERVATYAATLLKGWVTEGILAHISR